jgi:hypothetical protein
MSLDIEPAKFVEVHEANIEEFLAKDPEIEEESESEEEALTEEAAEVDEITPALSSIQQYLHDIGSVPLLNREREIELAMTIERGQREVFEAVFTLPMARRHVLELGDAVARGNKKVFEEIGREFARFLAVFGDDPHLDRDKIARFCAALRPGEPPEGQRLLSEAFTTYCEARFQTGKDQAEAILLANLCAGFHEQIRLQPEIAEALNAALGSPDELKRKILASLVPDLKPHWSRLLNHQSDLDDLFERLIDVTNEIIRQVITDHLMTLHLSGTEVLRLGRDLPGKFPDVLGQIANAKLRQMLAQIDPTQDNLIGSGADDWANFPDRMHFIADFFRLYQERRPLFDVPFTSEQVVLIKSGKRPDGPL